MILRASVALLILMLVLTNVYLRYEYRQLELIADYIEPELIRNSYFIACAKQNLDFKECHLLADEFVKDYLKATENMK